MSTEESPQRSSSSLRERMDLKVVGEDVGHLTSPNGDDAPAVTDPSSGQGPSVTPSPSRRCRKGRNTVRFFAASVVGGGDGIDQKTPSQKRSESRQGRQGKRRLELVGSDQDTEDGHYSSADDANSATSMTKRRKVTGTELDSSCSEKNASGDASADKTSLSGSEEGFYSAAEDKEESSGDDTEDVKASSSAAAAAAVDEESNEDNGGEEEDEGDSKPSAASDPSPPEDSGSDVQEEEEYMYVDSDFEPFFGYPGGFCLPVDPEYRFEVDREKRESAAKAASTERELRERIAQLEARNAELEIKSDNQAAIITNLTFASNSAIRERNEERSYVASLEKDSSDDVKMLKPKTKKQEAEILDYAKAKRAVINKKDRQILLLQATKNATTAKAKRLNELNEEKDRCIANLDSISNAQAGEIASLKATARGDIGEVEAELAWYREVSCDLASSVIGLRMKNALLKEQVARQQAFEAENDALVADIETLVGNREKPSSDDIFSTTTADDASAVHVKAECNDWMAIDDVDDGEYCSLCQNKMEIGRQEKELALNNQACAEAEKLPLLSPPTTNLDGAGDFPSYNPDEHDDEALRVFKSSGLDGRVIQFIIERPIPANDSFDAIDRKMFSSNMKESDDNLKQVAAALGIELVKCLWYYWHRTRSANTQGSGSKRMTKSFSRKLKMLRS